VGNGVIRAGGGVANLEIESDGDVAVAAASPGIGMIGANSIAGLGAITVTATFGVAGVNLDSSETLLNVALPTAGAGVLALATDRIALQAVNDSPTEATATLENRGGGPVLVTGGEVTVGSLTADTISVASFTAGSQTFESLTVQGTTPGQAALTAGHDDPDSIAVRFTGGQLVGNLAAADINLDGRLDIAASDMRFSSATGSEWRVTQANTPALTVFDQIRVANSDANTGMTIRAGGTDTTLAFDDNSNWQFGGDGAIDVTGTLNVAGAEVRLVITGLARHESSRFEFIGTDPDPDTLVFFLQHPTQGRTAEIDGSLLVSRNLTVLGDLNASGLQFDPATLNLPGATGEVTLTVNQSDPALAGYLQTGGQFEATASSVRVSSTEGAIVSVSNASFAALRVEGAPSGLALDASGNVAITGGDLTVTDGNLQLTTGDLTVGGNGTFDGDLTVGGTLHATVDVDLDTLFLNGEAGETTLTVFQSDAGLTAIKQEGGQTQLDASNVAITTTGGASISTGNAAAASLTLTHTGGGLALDIGSGRVRVPGGSGIVPKDATTFTINDATINAQTVPMVIFQADPNKTRFDWFEAPSPGVGVIHFDSKLKHDTPIKWILLEDP
jgi:hypothetical protein